jgi:hypothetical protein
LRQTELNQNNSLAWRLYWDTRLPAKELLLQLEDIELSTYEANETAYKIRVLAMKVNELEIRQAKEEARKGDKR